jgi:CBS domain-containing protein
LAVVERDDANALVGILTMSDIVRAQARAALAAEDADISVVPAAATSSEVKATEEQLASAIPK